MYSTTSNLLSFGSVLKPMRLTRQGLGIWERILISFLAGTGAVAAVGAFGGVVFRGAGDDKFGRFDSGEELVDVQGDSLDSVVAASA